jgi:hypothetical protein
VVIADDDADMRPLLAGIFDGSDLVLRARQERPLGPAVLEFRCFIFDVSAGMSGFELLKKIRARRANCRLIPDGP